MVYQGSKNRIAKFIVPIIQKYIDENNIDTYIEPFVGGCNIIDKVCCKRKIGSDNNEDLITLLQYVKKDNELSIAPEECVFEHYADVRSNRYSDKYSREYIALIGYCASYGGRYFEGGYGRDSRGERNIYKERLNNLKMQATNLKDIEFYCRDYKEYLNMNIKNAVFYLDPPYRKTKEYAKQVINYEEYYDFCRELSKDNIVLMSEYNMPENFKCVWKKERLVMQKSNRTKADKAIEKLFVCNGGVSDE